MTVIPFPIRTIDPLADFLDQAPHNSAIDRRAAELKQRARETVNALPPELVAEMLAYAAARLERTGFKMFR